MFIAQFLASVGFSTIFPFLPNYVEQLGSATGLSIVFLISAVFSSQAVAMMIASPIWGAIADRYGRKPMVERALFGGAIIVLLMGLARNAEELVVLRTIQGLVTGVVSAASSMVVSVTPKDRIGYAMGAMQTASLLGVSIGPVVGGLLEYQFGARLSFIITGILLFLGGFIVLFGVKEQFTPVPKKERPKGNLIAQWGLLLSAPNVLLTYSLRFLAWLARNMMVPFMPLFIITLMPDPSLASVYTGFTIAIASVAGAVSGFTLGRIGDKIGHAKVLIVSAFLTAVLHIPIAFAGSLWSFILFNTFVGYTVGGVLPMISSLLARNTTPEQAGQVYGLDNSVTAAARAIAPMVAGSFIGMAFIWGPPNYRVVYLVAGALFAITGAVALRLLNQPRVTTT